MSSSDSEDDLIAYGTPLEPLEEDEIPKKRPCSIEEQVVKDKQGRRRFHGAFTGGFSAGFFNTVGSLEGWAPSSFKSSRSNKQEISHQRPEDFMDEEDVSEFGISPMLLKAKKDYCVAGNKRKLPGYSNVSTLGTYVFDNVLQPVRETVGIKLLKKMGWKPGQGVGPHLRKSEKRSALKIRKKRYGCQLPPGVTEEDGEKSGSDSEWEDFEFAPNDYEPILCNVRTNLFGIGYKGLDKRSVLGSTNKGSYSEDGNKGSRFGSQAFGVGAFEEEDEDIYSKDDMSRYDFSLGNNQQNVNELIEKASAAISDILEGFIAEKKRQVKKHFPLPALPKDFKPQHKVHNSRFDPLPPEKEKFLKTQFNSQDRKLLLEGKSEELPGRKKREEELTKALISNVKISTSKFKPFAMNQDKQTRYESYLKLVQIGKKERLRDLQPLNMSEWDMERERVEFEKAAQLFKPLTGGMEDRFLTASQPDDLSDPLAVVEKFQGEGDDRRKAAKMNMFGPLTRTTEEWTPCQLLCKRFNIPEPRKGQTSVSTAKSEKKNFSLFDELKFEKNDTRNVVSEPSRAEVQTVNVPEVSESTTKLRKETDLDEITPENKIDIFKAIFLASDDEEDTEKEKRNEREEPQSEDKELLFEEKVINLKRNLSPPSGLFENINLESLAMRKQNTEKEGNVNKEAKEISIEKSRVEKEISVERRREEKEKSVEPELPTDLIYGPKIPDKVVVNVVSTKIENSSDDGEWVEKKDHKKHKKNKKNKKDSHKSKHKHKKHKR